MINKRRGINGRLNHDLMLFNIACIHPTSSYQELVSKSDNWFLPTHPLRINCLQISKLSERVFLTPIFFFLSIFPWIRSGPAGFFNRTGQSGIRSGRTRTGPGSGPDIRSGSGPAGSEKCRSGSSLLYISLIKQTEKLKQCSSMSTWCIEYYNWATSNCDSFISFQIAAWNICYMYIFQLQVWLFFCLSRYGEYKDQTYAI